MQFTLAPDQTVPKPHSPLVAILLGTHNGERYLRAQLDSISRQSYCNWILFASDDGSTDSTCEILKDFQSTQGVQRVRLFEGPRQGFSQNFLSLIRNPTIHADYFAFCDQDDVWLEHKLTRAIALLNKSHEKDRLAFYCSRTRLIDAQGRIIGQSRHFKRPPNFRNALVQSIGGANTIVLNEPARKLLARVPQNAPVVSHDWLCYLLISGNDGKVIYDNEPSVDYRQHGKNLIGSNTSLSAGVVRALRMLSGTLRQWNQDNLTTMLQEANLLNEHHRHTALLFKHALQANVLQRLYMLKKTGIHRQSSMGTLGLMLAACIRRL